MKKVLFTATVDSHILRFHLPYLEFFKNQGFEVHVATNGTELIPFCDVRHTVSFERSPFKFNNIPAFKQLNKVIKTYKFDLIHCHTPMGGVITRLAAMGERKNGTKVIYTAHGFHFYKDAPLLNWLVYYPIEKMLAKVTDVLICINEEDYRRAVLNEFKAKSIKRSHGVGIDTGKFKPVNFDEKLKLRKQYGYQDKDVLLIYVAELNKNKNQKVLIEAVKLLINSNPNIKLLLVGDGELRDEYQVQIDDLNITNNVKLLGVRTDIHELLSISDICVPSSIREGLPINLLEAMSCGLPIVASINRGHRELVDDGVNGFLVENTSPVAFASAIKTSIDGIDKKIDYHEINRVRVNEYSLSRTINEMKEIYLGLIS